MKETLQKILFWFVQLTWGILDNVLGLFVLLALLIAGKKPKRFGQQLYFTIGTGGSGFNFGFVAVVNNSTNGKALTSLLLHEHGHFIQNMFYGPFTTVLQLVSAARYWYRKYIAYCNTKYISNNQPEKYKPLKPYNAFWFESQADDLGYEYLFKEVLGRAWVRK